MDHSEGIIVCHEYYNSCVPNIEEKMVERDLKEQDEIMEKVSEESRCEEGEAFGKIF